jgi:hypothetical protein
MNDTFQCGDPGALVAYLYDECEPGERELIAAHITRCVTCASEIDTLGATRRTLAAWTPPEMALGFQITRAQDVGPAANQPAANQPARVLEPKIAWWRAPMPAWAQVAAALVIFAAGLSIGVARNGSPGQAASLDAGVTSVGSGVTTTGVSREDLAQLEQRIRADMSQLRGTSTSVTPAPASARVSDEAVMQQVKALLEQSEERQRRDFTLRMVDMASNIETQRRVDLASVSRSMVQQQGVVGTELRQQREAIDTFRNYLVNASERSR